MWFYVFIVFFFGFFVVFYIFIKIFCFLVGWWRVNGIYIVVFLDDGWFIVDDYNLVNIIVSRVCFDICLVGFIINSEKLIWELM